MGRFFQRQQKKTFNDASVVSAEGYVEMTLSGGNRTYKINASFNAIRSGDDRWTLQTLANGKIMEDPIPYSTDELKILFSRTSQRPLKDRGYIHLFPKGEDFAELMENEPDNTQDNTPP